MRRIHRALPRRALATTPVAASSAASRRAAPSSNSYFTSYSQHVHSPVHSAAAVARHFASAPAKPQIAGGRLLPAFVAGKAVFAEDNDKDTNGRKILYVSDKTATSTIGTSGDTARAETGSSGKMTAVGRVTQVSAKDISDSFAAAHAASSLCAQMSSHSRRTVLQRIAMALRDKSQEFAEAVALECGKPIRDASIEVQRAADTFELSAEESCRRPHNTTGSSFEYLDGSPRGDGFSGITSAFPAGVVSMVVPFNFPLNLAAHKIGPAIAAGCPFVLKPSDRTPASASLLGEVIAEAGSEILPAGSFSILPASNADAPLFSSDPRIRVLSFTGSAKVGWSLRGGESGERGRANDVRQGAGSRVRVVLELGGDAACIVDEGLSQQELAHAADRVTLGGFFQAGQSCISVQRCIVHASVYDEFRDLLIARASRIVPSDDILNPDTALGPVISESEAERICVWVQEALGRGAKLALGTGLRDGPFIHPHILENVPRDCKLYQEEIFGPVVLLERFGQSQPTAASRLGAVPEAVDLVNLSKYGLQTGIFTSSLHRAFFAFNNLHVGGVVVNDIPSTRIDSQPYGGVKESGVGREGVRFAIADFTEPRILLLKGLNP